MKFKCPECKAEVTKDAGDPIGCPCCGFKSEVQPQQLQLQLQPQQLQLQLPVLVYVPYAQPWEITWTSDGPSSADVAQTYTITHGDVDLSYGFEKN